MTVGDVITPSLSAVRDALEGAVPAVIATASADGTPNITYLSRVRFVDDERVALSNQFFSKTVRNLVENPRASVLVIDPSTYEQHRLTLVYERTDRRGPVFEALRDDVDVAAALHGMQDVFRLRSADIYRVIDVEHVPAAVHLVADDHADSGEADVAERGDDSGSGAMGPRAHDMRNLAELSARLGRCVDLETVVTTALAGLAELFGYEHSLLLLVDEEGEHLFTIASHGYDAEGVGSEVSVGQGVIGLAAQRGVTIRLANVRQLAKYSRTIRRSYEGDGTGPAGHDVPLPGMVDAKSQLAVPARSLGSIIGVLMVEDLRAVAYGPADESVLTVVASILATAIEADRARERLDEPTAPTVVPAEREATTPDRSTLVRFFAIDGSVFLDGDYLIKGVAGRILWSLLGHHARDGRTDFTNREIRLDASLDLPPFRDNFESRLVLLKRRLDEREAPIRIDKTGRGRFRLVVHTSLELDVIGWP